MATIKLTDGREYDFDEYYPDDIGVLEAIGTMEAYAKEHLGTASRENAVAELIAYGKTAAAAIDTVLGEGAMYTMFKGHIPLNEIGNIITQLRDNFKTATEAVQAENIKRAGQLVVRGS